MTWSIVDAASHYVMAPLRCIDKPASWMLERIRNDKDSEERRFLDGFLDRLSLRPSEVEKSERPDFFLGFDSPSGVVHVGCELVRFHALTEGPTRLDHGHRWKVFAVKLREELQRIGLCVCGVIQLRDGSSDAFEALLRHRDRSVAEICNALKRSGATTGSLGTFDRAVEPLLASAVDGIGWEPTSKDELWWCSSLQSGSLPDPWPSLARIVEEKDEKARAWNWRNVDERWLLVVAEGQTLGDTMVLTDADASTIIPAEAFSRTFLWDGFSEQIHQIHPTYGVVFEVDTQGRGTIHRRMFPSSVAACCPLLSGA